MARIYLQYTKNVLTEYPDYIMFLVFMVFSFTFISVRNVFENLPKDSLIAAFNFFVIALKQTHVVIQALLAGFLVRVTAYSSMLAYKRMRNVSVVNWLSKFGLRSDTENSAL